MPNREVFSKEYNEIFAHGDVDQELIRAAMYFREVATWTDKEHAELDRAEWEYYWKIVDNARKRLK